MQRRILHLNLTNGAWHEEILNESMRRKWIGGRGLNMWLLLRHGLPPADPLDPQAPLLIGAGPLAGLPCPSPSRCAITARSPETGLLGDSNLGGRFAWALRRTGFDHLVITGQAPQLSYLLITAHGPALCDASVLAGQDCMATQDYLQTQHGPDSQILCIGQAGENLVRFACVRHDHKSAAGRGGLGCLMGNKRLKAVVAVGDQQPIIAHPHALRSLTATLNARLLGTRTREVLHKHGTPFLFDLHNHIGIVRTKNGQESRFRTGRKVRSASFMPYYTGSQACYGCVIACRHKYTLRDHNGDEVHGVGPEYGVVGNFAPVCGIDDPEIILLINDKLNRYGIDASTCGNLLGWAMEMFEHGILTHEDTGGLDLHFGNGEAVLQCIEQIATGSGFGALLGQGPRAMAAHCGPAAEKNLMWSKNLLQSDSVDVRVYKGFALGVATSTRGADHLRSRPTMEALQLSAEQLYAMYGGEISPDPTSYVGKALMVYRSELEYALGDALGVCRFAQRFNSPEHLTPEELRQLFVRATGLNMDSQEFMTAAERMITLERLFLIRHGLGRHSDSLPDRYFEPLTGGGYKGACLDREHFEAMLEDYYLLHGWDRQNGVPTPATLDRLNVVIP